MTAIIKIRKKTNKKRIVLFVFLIVMIILGVYLIVDGWLFLFLALLGGDYVPELPNNVPHSAIWVGGADGGVWIDCHELENETNCFYCTVFADVSGAILVKDTCCLSERALSLDSLQNSFYAFDGRKIILQDMTSLVPIHFEEDEW